MTEDLLQRLSFIDYEDYGSLLVRAVKYHDEGVRNFVEAVD